MYDKVEDKVKVVVALEKDDYKVDYGENITLKGVGSLITKTKRKDADHSRDA